jgi:hypothetical protein
LSIHAMMHRTNGRHWNFSVGGNIRDNDNPSNHGDETTLLTLSTLMVYHIDFTAQFSRWKSGEMTTRNVGLQCLIRDHRAAIAMNSMGVSLLERKAYRQGMEALADAIFVIQRVLRPPSISSQGSDRTPNSTSYAEAKMHRASKRMAPIKVLMSFHIVHHFLIALTRTLLCAKV